MKFKGLFAALFQSQGGSQLWDEYDMNETKGGQKSQKTEKHDREPEETVY